MAQPHDGAGAGLPTGAFAGGVAARQCVVGGLLWLGGLALALNVVVARSRDQLVDWL